MELLKDAFRFFFVVLVDNFDYSFVQDGAPKRTVLRHVIDPFSNLVGFVLDRLERTVSCGTY